MVFEIDPILKREFHARLVREGRSAKDWLLERIEEYLAAQQTELSFAAEASAHYGKKR